MIIGILRTRLRPEAQAEYQAWAPRISALARETPGYLSHKAFIAEDGERLTLAEFADLAALQAWARHPEHLAAKRIGREKFFSELRVQVCAVQRDSAAPAFRQGLPAESALPRGGASTAADGAKPPR